MSYCYLDSNKKSICTSCTSGKFIPGENICLICPDNCHECNYDSNTKQSVCTDCYYNYVLNPTTKKCIYCNGLEGTGEGCSTCRYNITTKGYQCLSCASSYSYAYVTNIFKCFSNTDSTKIGLYNCYYAQYIESTDKYECSQCRYDFILVIPDKSCIERYSSGLSNCIEAEKKGDKYSCTKCSLNDQYNAYTMVKDEIKGINNCYKRTEEFSFCLEGTMKSDGTKICTKCDTNSKLDTPSQTCSCNADSFNKSSTYCYKCNDDTQGNPRCDITVGCNYTKDNNELKCNKCLKGFLEYTGQCLSCSDEIYDCDQCHYDSGNNKLLCDNCLNSLYVINSENKCSINDCVEYPDISPGCMICKDGLNNYLQNKKCQYCKYGYFKTKDEKCVYCKSEQYGGPACYECGYEGDNIVCKNCLSNELFYQYGMFYYYDVFFYYYDNDYYYDYNEEDIYNKLYLTPDGKCYDCQIELSKNCKKCELAKNNDGSESLKCVLCSPAYYVSPEGKCLNYTSLIKRIDHCQTYNYLIAGKNYTLNDHDYDYDYVRYSNYYYDDYNHSALTFNDIKGEIPSTCISCEDDYYLNDEGKCEKLTLDECSFLSILQNYNKFLYACQNLCNSYHNIKIELQLTKPLYDTWGSKLNTISIDNIIEEYLSYFKNTFGESNELKACFITEENNYPIHLKDCYRAVYYHENNSYVCQSCRNGDYILDYTTHQCIPKSEREKDLYFNDDYNCNISKNTTQEYFYYYCQRSWNEFIYFTLVTFDNGENQCLEAKDELEGCSEAIGDTDYINITYNCTKCLYGYSLYYSKFYGRYICQNLKVKIKRKKEIIFDNDIEVIVKVNKETGKCDKEYLYTPDGENCYKCDDIHVGNPGCKGSCSFSINRNDTIKCEGECKSGYIESSKGVCSHCSAINEGCHECHYENNNQSLVDNLGIKRKRNFVCDYCEEGYFKSDSSTCLSCEKLGLSHCYRCEIDPKNNSKYICTKCYEYYFLFEDGQCYEFVGSIYYNPNNKKYLACADVNEGGIANCDYCKFEGEKHTCIKCNKGYILLSNNNSCLEI